MGTYVSRVTWIVKTVNTIEDIYPTSIIILEVPKKIPTLLNYIHFAKVVLNRVSFTGYIQSVTCTMTLVYSLSPQIRRTQLQTTPLIHGREPEKSVIVLSDLSLIDLVPRHPQGMSSRRGPLICVRYLPSNWSVDSSKVLSISSTYT